MVKKYEDSSGVCWKLEHKAVIEFGTSFFTPKKKKFRTSLEPPKLLHHISQEMN